MIQHCMQRRRRGFTLIELLVVIAIIALLAAILFPVFARVRENARRSSCQSNLKQIALGFHQYVQDYDEHYPNIGGGSGCSTSSNGLNCAPPTAGWGAVIQPYVKSWQILQCPSEKNSWTTGTGRTNATDYFLNLTLSPYIPDNNIGTIGLAVSELTFASCTIMNGDAASGIVGQYGDIDKLMATTGTTTEWGLADPLNTGNSRHLDGANYSFTDGHVRWFKLTSLASCTGTPPLAINYSCTAPNGSNFTFAAK